MAQSTSQGSASPSPRDEAPSDTVLNTTVCSLCRQRKVKCDRRRPVCGYCFKGGFQCEYSVSNRKRGLRAGYVSELERRVAILEREFRLFREQGDVSPDTRDQHAQTIVAPRESPRLGAPQNEQDNSHLRYDTFIPEVREPPYEMMVGLVKIWFNKYHPWHPILHRPSLEEYLQFRRDGGDGGDGGDDTQTLIFKAIAAVIIPSSYPDLNLSQEDRFSWSQSLRRHILFRAVSEISVHGLQAMLILTVLDYGNGSLSNFWNLIGICQRLSMQLGLRDMVVNYCINYGKPSIIPPRMLSIPSTIVGYEERIRAFWITEILDSTSTLGVAWNFNIPRPEINVWTPCEDDMWTLPNGLIRMLPFGTSETPGSFSLYVRLVSNELWHVHKFLQQSYDMTVPGVCEQRQADCQAVDQRLLKWQSEFDNIAKANSPAISPSISSGDPGLISANVILTYCTLDTAIIALYQRLVILPNPIEGTTEVWYQASSRCMQACNHLVSILRTVADEDLECMSPQLIACIFVTARFYIMHARAMHMDVPPKLDLLKYVLKTCGLSWPLARRLGKVLCVATMEQDSAASKVPLPEQFYDLQYSWPDIDDALQKWAERT